MHGYETIPTTMMDDAMPPQFDKSDFLREETARDVLVALGLREIVSYRFTAIAREAQLVAARRCRPPCRTLPTSRSRTRLRRRKACCANRFSSACLEAARANARYADQQECSRSAASTLGRPGQLLPDEPRRLGVLITGRRDAETWITPQSGAFDFYDLKGVVEGLLDGLHIAGASVRQAQHPSFHPGRCAELVRGDAVLGVFGELHPQVSEAFELTGAVLAADLDLEALLPLASDLHAVRALPVMPPVLQDIALVVDEDKTHAEVEAVIRKAGGGLLKDVRLFDVYRGDPDPGRQEEHGLQPDLPDRRPHPDRQGSGQGAGEDCQAERTGVGRGAAGVKRKSSTQRRRGKREDAEGSCSASSVSSPRLGVNPF